MPTLVRSWTVPLLSLAALLVGTTPALAAPPKKIVLIAGTKSHGPGDHEYEKGARLLKHCLDTSPNLKGFVTELHLDGWPKDERTLDDAATIFLYSDGSDRDEQAHPLLRGQRLRTLQRLMDRGVGFVAVHYTVFVPTKRGGEQFLDWAGGYFDYENGPKPRSWYSKIQTAVGKVALASPDHPISRGLSPFEVREEFYYNMRLRPDERGGVASILRVALPGEKEPQTVAWAAERKNGGRGFAYTGGHFHKNWQNDNVRRMVLNALVWTAGGDVPPGGVASTLPEEERPIKALIVTGHQHPAHDWRATTKALQDVLGADPRLAVTVVEGPEFLAKKELKDHDVLILNYQNHERAGLSAQARNGLMEFVEGGKGLVVVHFANGAFGDWPEYRRLARRVWVDKISGHDAFGKFIVEIAKKDHPITQGLPEYETTDELYFRQQGELPIEVLLTARSKVTGKAEPMAFVYRQGKGNVFQTVLGHDAAAIRNRGTAEVVRRGTAWAAGRPAVTASRPPVAQPDSGSSKSSSPLTSGKFAQALDARVSHAEVKHQAAYQAPPLTVECWAKLDSARSFNLLVANNLKESKTHWEMYSIAGSGHFSAYLPGYSPDLHDSGVRITDGKWHHLAMVLEPARVRLYVDGRQVRDEKLTARSGTARDGALWLGAYPPGGLGCDGLIDDVRLRRGAHPIDRAPDRPVPADADTLGLWPLDGADNGRLADAGSLKNPAVLAAAAASPSAQGPSSDTELDYRPADDRLRVVLLDRSLDESFVSIKADTEGRLFVGGREALFVYEPDRNGGYQARRELFRFPPDAWVAGVEIRGDDLYVLTASALYRFPGGRLRRDGLKPERLVWGLPLDLHVSYHCLAWGPEGDLYFNHGDPLLGYGDFSRPDHWGHWTVFGPGGERVPYTGNGGVLRVRPDGRGFRPVAGGLRGPFGLTFDHRWNLFTNDNDHESRPDLYTPGRLLHVTPQVDFAWPRGWIASKLPERADLVEAMHNIPGRGVPVGMCYYNDPFIPELRHTLLQTRWDALTVQRHAIAPRGASYAATEEPFLIGRVRARPVGVAVGRGGRVFVAVSYMAGNEASPHYISDLVMVTRRDDPPNHPFEAYDVTRLPPEKLWAELSQPSWERRREAHTEILRRGRALLTEAGRRLAAVTPDDPARPHLAWLAGASRDPEVRALLEALARDPKPELREQAVRILAEFAELKCPPSFFERAAADADPRVRLAALAAFFDPSRPLPLDTVTRLGRESDTYLRQTATRLLAQRATLPQMESLAQASDAPGRLAAVLAAGFRLTVPIATTAPPAGVPLFYPKANPFFQTKIRFGDNPSEEVELAKLGRIGSYTTAEMWRAVTPTDEQRALFDLMTRALKDPAERVRLQAAYFLSLVRDARTEPLVAATVREVREGRLANAAVKTVNRAWLAGPFAANEAPIGGGPVDLTAEYATARGKVAWREQALPLTKAPFVGPGAYYVFFHLQSGVRQPLRLDVAAPAVKAWHNGRPLAPGSPGVFLLDLQPGSNDLLLRVEGDRLAVQYRARSEVRAALPEKLGAALLAQRLREAGSARQDAVSAAFLAVDWPQEARRGNAEAGRKLFGSLACAKCHAITVDQPGGGAPSLTGAGKRFTVAHLVESILLPSRQVAEPFRGTTILTKKGLSVSGLVVSETAEAIELLLADATRKSIARNEIDERTMTHVSPMPAGLVKTPDELRDLLAYLLSDNPTPP